MWRVTLTWNERDDTATYSYARHYEYPDAAAADTKYAELARLITDNAWRPNLRAFDVQVDRPEPIRTRHAA